MSYINKPWHKSSDESATLNTLEKLPRLAQCRQTGQIGGEGDRGGNSDEEKVGEGTEKKIYRKEREKGGGKAREIYKDGEEE